MPSPLPLLAEAEFAGPLDADAGVAANASPDADGEKLFVRLRSPLELRPAVDPGLAGGLRAWLEDGVAALAALDGSVTIQPDAAGGLGMALHDGRLPGKAAAHSRPGNGNGATTADAVGLRAVLLRTVFLITVTAGPLRAPFEDALAALAVDGEGDVVVQAVQRLSRHRRAQLREAVRRAAGTITAHWSAPPTVWLPRTGEPLAAPLAGGRVVLRTTADLVMGAPSAGRASVCALRAHAGSAGGDDAPARRFLALLETLRSGAAPFRVASYDLEQGRLTIDDVTDELLSTSVRDVLDLVDRAHARREAAA